MKTIILSIIISILTYTNISAQNNIENKDWLIKTLNFNGKTMPYYQHIMFKTDGYVQMEGRVFGRWKYNKKENTLSIESRLIKEFAGNWEIKKLTKNKFEIVLDKTSMNMELFNETKLISENTKANIFGIWSYIENNDEITYFNFEKPNKITSTSITIDRTSNSSSSGYWFYNSKDKTLIIPDRHSTLSGVNKLEIKNNTEAILTSKQGVKTLIKISATANSNELMPFENNADFFTQNGLIKNNEILQETLDKFENNDVNINAEYLKKLNKLTYNKKLYIKDFNVFAKFTTNIEINEEEGYYNTLRGFGASNIEKNNYLYPIKKAGTFDNVYSFNEKEITVKAGKFLCNVYYVDFDDQKLLLYMIKDKPGVYAKIIITEKNYNDEIENTIYELTNIEM